MFEQTIRNAYKLSKLPKIRGLEVTQLGPENEGPNAVATIAMTSPKSSLLTPKSSYASHLSNVSSVVYPGPLPNLSPEQQENRNSIFVALTFDNGGIVSTNGNQITSGGDGTAGEGRPRVSTSIYGGQEGNEGQTDGGLISRTMTHNLIIPQSSEQDLSE